MRTALRLALVDDHELFRYSLGSVLGARGFEMVAEAADARTGFPLIDQTRPDVVLLDVALPRMDGITAVREIISRPAKPKILMLSAYDSPHLVGASLEAGAHGYATKAVPIDELVGAIHLVAEGKRYIAPGLVTPAIVANGPLFMLSARECDIFRLMTAGMTMREVAAELCISVKTAETHRQRIFRKLNVHSAVQLVRFAVANDVSIAVAMGQDLTKLRH
jgi:DNA-binding NarL/FixJ family response regulator